MNPAVAPIAVDCKGAGDLFGISDRSWRRMNAAGLCPQPIQLGGKGGAVRWMVDELTRWGLAGSPSRARWEQVKESK